jgi:peptidoglycan hydrolase-like protein with peptidoglycan-binding domain
MHDINGKWIGFGLGDAAPTVTKIQHRLVTAYGSYSIPLGVKESGVYDQATADAVSEFQKRVGFPATGIANYATEVRMGVVVAPPVIPSTVDYTVAGTWAGWADPAPPTWTAWNVDQKRFQWQGVGYLAEGFLTPDPTVSYNMSRDGGTAELLRLALPDRRRKVLIGYSQGADVVTRALLQWPADRQSEIACVITFGSPGRRPGPTLLGNNPPGAGISGVYTPQWAWPVTYDFVLDGDMYPCAVGLLPFLYDILTRMDTNADFIMYLFQLLLSSVGGQLLGTVTSALPGAGLLSGLLGLVTSGPTTQTTGPVNLVAMLLNIPAIIQTLIAALQFVITNAHQHYNDTPAFGGLTGVQKAIQIIDALPV